MWRMEQYFQEISRLVASAWLDRTVPFPLGRKFPEMQDRQVLETGICRIEQKFMIRPVQPKKGVHLKWWTFYSESFPVGPNRTIQFRTEISGNFGQMKSALCLRIV